MDARQVEAVLAGAGCVAADEEAAELLAHASAHATAVDELIRRRVTGEPLAWIVGHTAFCGLQLNVSSNVYVPRWQTEPMTERAAAALDPTGIAVDFCTGAGAVAAVLQTRNPGAQVYGVDISEAAVACARSNGVNALVGDLDSTLPHDLAGTVDLITAVVPYVPTEDLHLLPRDVLVFEKALAVDGGASGTAVLSRLVSLAPKWMREGGRIFLEIGGNQAQRVSEMLAAQGFEMIDVMADDDGDVRAITATFGLRS